jgi:hypothetical protein
MHIMPLCQHHKILVGFFHALSEVQWCVVFTEASNSLAALGI